uniref:Uncharacterized protein n=1 Tax=Bursaphelenchus xylophilus TaxID=6326 RepID=A0A1I7RMS5_BURXY
MSGMNGLEEGAINTSRTAAIGKFKSFREKAKSLSTVFRCPIAGIFWNLLRILYFCLVVIAQFFTEYEATKQFIINIFL